MENLRDAGAHGLEEARAGQRLRSKLLETKRLQIDRWTLVL